MPGPQLRTDIVDVYVLRQNSTDRCPAAAEFLQLRRTGGAMSGTWQPVMGHIEQGETAQVAAMRELREETGLQPGCGLVALWQLELVNAYFLAAQDEIMLSVGFAAEVLADAELHLDEAHDSHRWVRRDMVQRDFLWPGQRAAIDHIVGDILSADSPSSQHLRCDLGGR